MAESGKFKPSTKGKSMTKFQVTLADLRNHGACVSGYNKVVRMLQGKEFTAADKERDTHIRFKHEAPIFLADIARNNGLGDALWTLRCIPDIDRDARLYAVWCARQVEHLMTDARSKEAIDVAERYANGDATNEELEEARNAAWKVYGDAPRSAARTVAIESSSAACDSALAASWAKGWCAYRSTGVASEMSVARKKEKERQFEVLIAMCKGRAPWQM